LTQTFTANSIGPAFAMIAHEKITMNLAELFHHETDLQVVAPGTYLFQAGDPPDNMYVLLHGNAQVLVADRVVEEAVPGSLVGEMALIDRAPRAASVKAVSECKFVPIDQKRFYFLVTQTPHFATHVMKIMSNRLRAMNQLLSAQQPDRWA